MTDTPKPRSAESLAEAYERSYFPGSYEHSARAAFLAGHAAGLKEREAEVEALTAKRDLNMQGWIDERDCRREIEAQLARLREALERIIIYDVKGMPFTLIESLKLIASNALKDSPT